MRVDVNKLKGNIAEKGMTQEAVAKAIGIDAGTFSRKMKCDGLAFTVGQMHQIVDILDITPSEAAHIFLAENSQKCEISARPQS